MINQSPNIQIIYQHINISPYSYELISSCWHVQIYDLFLEISILNFMFFVIFDNNRYSTSPHEQGIPKQMLPKR